MMRGRKEFAKAASLGDGLEWLMEQHWFTEVTDAKTKGPGRSRGRIFELHPEVFEDFEDEGPMGVGRGLQ